MALLRPCLLPLSGEQQAEAVALLAELLLSAARRRAKGRDPAADDAEASRWWSGASVPGELGWKGLAA
jgi:hypothetical protein